MAQDLQNFRIVATQPDILSLANGVEVGSFMLKSPGFSNPMPNQAD